MRTSLIFALFLSLLACKPALNQDITTEEIRDHLQVLASDSLKGRYPGTPEDQVLLQYIVDQYKAAGLRLLDGTGLQPFSMAMSIEAGPDNRVSAGSVNLVPDSEFRPMSFSASEDASGPLLFAGYGFQFRNDSMAWDDYAGTDPAGSWVMILRGTPPAGEDKSPYTNYSEARGKALLAQDLGAVGVLLVSPESLSPTDELDALTGRQHPLHIPVIQLTRTAAGKLLLQAGLDSIGVLEAKLNESASPHSARTGVQVRASADLIPRSVETGNTVAILEGADVVLKEEYVLLGAHHDHLGFGGPGSSSRTPDTVAVHYGADDNASGVTGILEIAEKMQGLHPRRSLVFATFGAEESGLVGSKFLAENPPVDLDEVQAMINLDMVGRLNADRQLQIGGLGTSPVFRELVDSVNATYGFNIKYANEGYGPSDHASFYAKDVPVLFVSTGAHPEYHTPADDLESVNLEGTREVLDFVSDLALALANRSDRIVFAEAGPKVSGSSRGRRGGITLGLMPDVTYDGSDGMPVMFVTEGKPAAVSGIQKGDVIVAIEGKSVGNVYDYMSRLGDLKEGQSVVVRVKRNGDPVDILVKL
ncbi:MAG: M28 family peptidase [Bacteroidales bacterium]